MDDEIMGERVNEPSKGSYRAYAFMWLFVSLLVFTYVLSITDIGIELPSDCKLEKWWGDEYYLVNCSYQKEMRIPNELIDNISGKEERRVKMWFDLDMDEEFWDVDATSYEMDGKTYVLGEDFTKLNYTYCGGQNHECNGKTGFGGWLCFAQYYGIHVSINSSVMDVYLLRDDGDG